MENIEEKFKDLLEKIDDEKMHIIDKLQNIVNFLRPENPHEIEQTLKSLKLLTDFFNTKSSIATEICDQINILFNESKISSNIISLGILSKYGFSYEIKDRFYNKFLPNPPKKGDLKYIFTTLFYKKNDSIWVNKIQNSEWIEFFTAIFSSKLYILKTKNHLYSELLYAIEILSIFIASEESNENFIRLDNSFLNKDSAFIVLQRSIADLISKIQANKIEIKSVKSDFEHIEVLIKQCNEQIDKLKKKSVSRGISIDLTYELERLTQIIIRLEYLLQLFKQFDTKESNEAFVELFKETTIKNETKNSLIEVYKQSSQIIARSITNNASEHGEHYIVNSTKEYIKMFFSAAGAGIIIAFMALIKINIMQAQLSIELETTLASLNYGLGFVLIHLFGFTVATKQPAMTASNFAQAVEKEENKRTASKKRLVELVFDVSRSQFAAVVGNVSFALFVAFLIAYFVINSQSVILSAEETQYYLKKLEPLKALFFAATAGIWLFLAGLISGYFDNRADLLQLKQRYYHHPILKKVFSNEKREKLARYLHEHHGAIAGNFFFGLLLGVTPFIGYLLNLPLDIAHVAFSSAYLGFASIHFDITLYEFIYYLACVLLIGVVNLLVSFTLALKVSLLSRDASFGSFPKFLKILLLEVLKRPHDLILPFAYKKKSKD